MAALVVNRARVELFRIFEVGEGLLDLSRESANGKRMKHLLSC